jgi:glutaredoxin
MTKQVFYDAGCPGCVDAEQLLAHALDAGRYEVEIVHLGEHRERIPETERAGVKSVPALVLEGSHNARDAPSALSNIPRKREPLRTRAGGAPFPLRSARLASGLPDSSANITLRVDGIVVVINGHNLAVRTDHAPRIT